MAYRPRIGGALVALSRTVCGLPTPLLGMLRVADNEPSSIANNTTVIVQLCSGASERGHQLTDVKIPWSVPGAGLTDTCDIDTGTVPVLVSVTFLY